MVIWHFSSGRPPSRGGGWCDPWVNILPRNPYLAGVFSNSYLSDWQNGEFVQKTWQNRSFSGRFAPLRCLYYWISPKKAYLANPPGHSDEYSPTMWPWPGQSPDPATTTWTPGPRLNLHHLHISDTRYSLQHQRKTIIYINKKTEKQYLLYIEHILPKIFNMYIPKIKEEKILRFCSN